MFDVSNVGLSARLAIGCGGRALVCRGYVDCRLGYGDLPCRGLSRLHHEAGVELIFAEEQQALGRVAVFRIDVPRDGGGPRPTYLQDANVRTTRRVRTYACSSVICAGTSFEACAML